MVMLNVRMEGGLKAEGDSVLAHAGITATEAIRSLYRFMEETREVPACCYNSVQVPTVAQRRQQMRSLVGIAPLGSNEDVNTIKAERLSRHRFE